MTRTKKILAALLIAVVATIGITVVTQAPAGASVGGYANCQALFSSGSQSYYPYVTGTGIGRMRLCVDGPGNTNYGCYNAATLYTTSSGVSSCVIPEIWIQLWDYNDEPGADYIFVEYQTWGQPNVVQVAFIGPFAEDQHLIRDTPGGPAQVSFWDYGPNIDNNSGLRWVRFRDSASGVFKYLYKSTGAGGCGYQGNVIAGYCPMGSY